MPETRIAPEGAMQTPALTPMQLGMLIHGVRAETEGAYVQQLVWTLEETVDVSLFHVAWQHLVDRHEVLRTSFQLESPDGPIQMVHGQVDWSVEVSDWRELGIAHAERRFKAYLRDERRRGFAIAQSPLWRWSLFRLDDSDSRLVWTSHHALFDGRSRLILLRELLALYNGINRGTVPALAPARPFGDHVRWLTARDFSASQGYWRKLLRGFGHATPLPGEERRALADAECIHQTLDVALTEECTAKLREIASQIQITLNTIVQGAWALLLGFYAGNDDVVFGATRACRPSSLGDVESMVGLFINTLPVRVRITGAAFLPEWLKEIRSQWISLREHEHTPLAEVQRWSEVPTDEPLFESVVMFETYALVDSLREATDSWPIRDLRLLGTTNYPLVVAAHGGTRLRIELTCDRRRFADETLLEIRARFQTLLEGIALEPCRTLAELPMITPRERVQLVSDWNSTATPFPRDTTVVQLFEAQVGRTPDAIALAFRGGRWTYEQLNARANLLARRLRGLGVGFEIPVAICAERSPERIAAMLGILKAGGAYVPLDPAFPQQRLQFILSDTRTPVLITERNLGFTVTTSGLHVLYLDDDRDERDAGASANPPCPATFDSLAYIMYTSGSTGTPKGVAVLHRGIIRLLFGVDYITLDSTRKILHLASPAFDASTFEIWGPLLHGGQCVLYDGRVLALDLLEPVIRENEVDTLLVTTALFNAIIDESARILSGVKDVLVGGDVLSVNHVSRALAQLPATVITNAYGPTETTTFATTYRIPREMGPGASSVPIGKPIGNTTVYLLNSLGMLVPPGVPGELYIGGPGVARGYWNQPDLTVQRFLRNEFDQVPEAVLYRTGDLCRRLPDGNIEFLGRLDGQVKIRGYRIEVGEIAAALMKHEDVREAVVIADGESRGVERRLIAYVVPRTRPPRPVDPAGLKSFLKEILPDFMVPAAFVFLEALPLSPTGKVDRQRLPSPEARPVDGEQIRAARTPVQARLAGIFAELLGRDQVDIHDDFFRLGGHSLLAMQAVARARQALGINLPLVSLFDKPTVARLASFVEHLLQAGPAAHASPIERTPRAGVYPLLCSQLSVWDVHRAYPGKTRVNTSRAYRLRGPLSREALHDAMKALVERHESLRTNFVEIDGAPAQVVSAPGQLDLPLVDLSRLPEPRRLREAQRQFDLATRHFYDLATDDMLRPALLRLSDEDHVLVLIFNHIVMDGWSFGIFVRELSGFYNAFSARIRPALAELPLQPVDIACWERHHFQTPAGQEQLAYWKDRLADAHVVPCFASDGPRLESVEFRSDLSSISVEGDMVEALRKLGQREGCTLSMTLFAALNVLAYAITRQDDIVVGMPVAARNRPELDGIIGCFRKRVILRTDLSGRPTYRDVLSRVRDVTIGAYLHLDASMEIAFPERGVDHPAHWMRIPLNFNFIENTGVSLTLDRLAVTPLTRSEHINWSDLMMIVIESHDRLDVQLMYRKILYSPRRIMGLLQHYRKILEAMIGTPNQRLFKIPGENPLRNKSEQSVIHGRP
jgi:amino acid adenylation domain-containing protein